MKLRIFSIYGKYFSSADELGNGNWIIAQQQSHDCRRVPEKGDPAGTETSVWLRQDEDVRRTGLIFSS